MIVSPMLVQAVSEAPRKTIASAAPGRLCHLGVRKRRA